MDFPGRITAVGDFIGDWREEVIAHVDGKLRIYATIEPTSYKRTWLMADRHYATQVCVQTMGYPQAPLSSYDVSEEVEPVEDCNGDLGGSAYTDNCGNCVGGNTGNNPCVVDCNGDENGSASIDNCGNCAGGNTGLDPCPVITHYEVDFTDPDDDYTINGSATNTFPTNEIIDGRYALSAMEATFESEIINIQGLSNVIVSVDIEASPASEFEEADYCNVYYKLNGGELVAISENTGGFNNKTVSVTGLSGNSIQVVIQTKNSHEMEFHYLDNIIIMGEGSVSINANPFHTSAVAGIEAFPNPFRTSVEISVSRTSHAARKQVELEVFDIAGNKVAHLKLLATSDQRLATSYTWHAQDQPAGLYLVKVRVGNNVLTKKITLMK
jgi:hypothetical protein